MAKRTAAELRASIRGLVAPRSISMVRLFVAGLVVLLLDIVDTGFGEEEPPVVSTDESNAGTDESNAGTDESNAGTDESNAGDLDAAEAAMEASLEKLEAADAELQAAKLAADAGAAETSGDGAVVETLSPAE